MEGYENIEQPQVTADLAGLSRLAEQLADADKFVAKLEEELRQAKMRVTDISERAIPDLMDELGVAEFTTTNGFKITIRSTVRASIPLANRAEAYQWLEENGHGGLLKRTVSVAFNRDQQDDVCALRNELEDKFENVKEDCKVEPSTLRRTVGGWR